MDRSDAQPRPAVMTTKSKLRYPLRSGKKLCPSENTASSSATASNRYPQSTVSKSTSNVELSRKERSLGPPSKSLSAPTSARSSQQLPSTKSVTPSSEKTQMKTVTPTSTTPKSGDRRRFCALSSVSYWVSQVKLAEAVGKHSISLGFFRLALESGCEPLDRLCEELKSYTVRHDLLSKLEEPAKELLQIYHIEENFKVLQVLESHSFAPEDGKNSAKKNRSTSPSAAKAAHMKSSPSNKKEAPKVAGANKKGNHCMPTAVTRTFLNKVPAKLRSFNKTSKTKALDSNKADKELGRPTSKTKDDNAPVDSHKPAEEAPEENKKTESMSVESSGESGENSVCQSTTEETPGSGESGENSVCQSTTEETPRSGENRENSVCQSIVEQTPGKSQETRGDKEALPKEEVQAS